MATVSMSTSATHSAASPAEKVESALVPDHSVDSDQFSEDEIRQFAADDAEAGRRIGKILATLFVYTLIAMAVVTCWTFRVVQP